MSTTVNGLPPIMPPGTAVNPPAPPATAQAGAGGVPEWLVLGVALVVTGAVAEGLYRISPAAGYLFAVVVVMGYLAVGGRIAVLQAFLSKYGIKS